MFPRLAFYIKREKTSGFSLKQVKPFFKLFSSQIASQVFFYLYVHF